MTEPRDDTDPAEANGDIDLSGDAPRSEIERVDIHEDLDEPAPVEERAPRTLKGAAVVSARLVAGAAGLAVAALTLGAAIFLPLPSLSVEPPAVEVVPAAAGQQRGCAGPLLRLGDDAGAQATRATALGTPNVTSGSSGGDPERSIAVSPDDAGADILSLPSRDAGAEPLLAASQSQAVARGDFRGLSAAECVEPRDDVWLVGGATTTGRTTLLTVVNPGKVGATIEITVYSDAGAVSAPGTSGISIPAGEQRVFSLAGLAPGLSSPVVRVQSNGALVVASLQQSTVRTLEPGGVDIITAAATPSTALTIPGILFPDHEALEASIAGEDYLDLNAALRVFVPGGDQAHAVITMVPLGDATEEPVDISVTLDPGRTTELPLGEFEAGRYAARITSDVPIVAGMRVATVNDEGVNDFVWLSAVESLEDRAVVAVAEGPTPVMSLFNPTDAAAEVSLTRGDTERVITVEPGRGVAFSVTPGEIYGLDDFDELAVSIGFLGDGSIAAHSVSPRAPSSTPIVVYP